MKKRLAKKRAKQYLQGRLRFRTSKNHWNIDIYGNYVEVTVAILHPMVEHFVLEMTAKMWNTCWEKNPLYHSIQEFRFLDGKWVSQNIPTIWEKEESNEM